MILVKAIHDRSTDATQRRWRGFRHQDFTPQIYVSFVNTCMTVTDYDYIFLRVCLIGSEVMRRMR